MRPAKGLASLEKIVFGWLPTEPTAADPHGAPRPWWWLTMWSMGVFVAEVGVLNMIVPVSTLGLPLLLANMWLCFMAGGVAGYWISKRMGYQASISSGRGWGERPRWWVAIPVAAELAIGVAYFSIGNWDYVFTNCLTGNACTFFQLAPAMFLILGVISLGILGVNEVSCRVSESRWRTRTN